MQQFNNKKEDVELTIDIEGDHSDHSDNPETPINKKKERQQSAHRCSYDDRGFSKPFLVHSAT